MIDDVRADAREMLLGGDASDGSVLAVGASLATLVAAILTFLFRPVIAVPVLGAFVIVTAVGLVTYQAEVARLLTLVATVLTVLTVTFITIFLFASALPAFLEHGLGLLLIPVQEGQVRWFFWLDAVLPAGETYWNPSGGAYSLVPAIWATVMVTLISAAIAGPLGLFGALFIAEVASDGMREIIKPGVEVLAGIPSIVYGFIGFQVLNSFVQRSFLDDGASFLIAGIVVGVMALPTVVSVGEDALSSVPDSMGDGSVAMGATKWQTMKSISIPAAFSGISAGVILGLGRAIGETMAVAAIMAAGVGLADPLYDFFDASATLTSLIAVNYGSASASTIDVLFVAGVMLFVIVAGMSVVSQYIERRMQEKLKGQA
ncbi:phosphate ABC transporter permease subunit PstC [Haloarcula litorea]|uniref:phosphate ABC transporter permease subunit PstC n=1 Tax=Haloarcula litorea TaxID=3032579 RepID=UPI0023E7A7A3|nr:phosphate ABC transporter permease subunit PstC [Halomicroarcula sp. GDY20]